MFQQPERSAVDDFPQRRTDMANVSRAEALLMHAQSQIPLVRDLAEILEPFASTPTLALPRDQHRVQNEDNDESTNDINSFHFHAC